MTVDFHLSGPTTSPHDAATVLVLRDGLTSLEVFFVKRSPSARFMANAYVFPGGRIDPGDLSPDVPCDLSLDTAALRWPAHPPALSLALHITALRETLEESGLLLCSPPPSPEDISSLRQALSPRNAPPIGPLLSARKLTLEASSLRPWSRWITPAQESPRFDARFFIARAPASLSPLSHDGSETVASTWLSPSEALSLARDNHIVLAPPTWRTLTELSSARTVAEVFSLPPRDLNPIEPSVSLIDNILTVLLPDDPAHPSHLSPTQNPSPIALPTRFTYNKGTWHPATFPHNK